MEMELQLFIHGTAYYEAVARDQSQTFITLTTVTKFGGAAVVAQWSECRLDNLNN